MESFEFPGVWWIPTDPEKTKFYGPLRFDPKNGGKLSLTVDRVGADHVLFDTFANLCIPIVHGKMDGRKVTLIRCHKRFGGGWNRDSAGDAYVQTAIVWTNLVFLGVHFESLKDIQFPWMSVSYTHMDRWLGIERFHVDDDGKPSMQPFPGIGVRIDDDLDILFYRASYENIGDNNPPHPEVLIAEIRPVRIMAFASPSVNEQEVSQAYYPYIFRYLRDFLNLVTGEPNNPFNIATNSPYDERQLVKIFCRIPGYDPNADRRIEASFTIEYDFIKSKLPEYLKTWISKSSVITSACDLYFKRYYLSNIDVETQFLFLVQAIEAYHRQKKGDTYLDPVDYSRVKDTLSTEIKRAVTAANIVSWAQGEVNPKDISSLKHSLLNAVKYGNEFSLRRRLKFICEEILRDYLELTESLLENPKVFVHRVARPLFGSAAKSQPCCECARRLSFAGSRLDAIRIVWQAAVPSLMI